MNPTMSIFEYADYISAYAKELVALVDKRLDDAKVNRANYRLDLTTIQTINWLANQEAFIAAALRLHDEIGIVYYDEPLDKEWATKSMLIAANALYKAVSSNTLIHNGRYIEFHLQRLRDVDSPEKFIDSRDQEYTEMGMKYLAPTKEVDNE
jgi:hypothetical protein